MMHRWRCRLAWGMTVGMLLVSLTGCWDSISLTQRATAVVLTVTPTSSPAKNLQWTFYFPNPTVTVSSLAQISSGEQLYSATVSAGSLAQAFQDVQERLARDVYLGHLESVVVSSKLTGHQVEQVVEELNRDGRVPKTSFIAASSTPKAAMTPNIQVVMPFIYLTQFFSCSICQPLRMDMPMWRFWSETVIPGESAVLPVVGQDKKVEQIVVYRDGTGQPVTYGISETRGWAFLTGRVDKASLEIPFESGDLAVTALHGSAKASKILMRGNTLTATVQIHVHGAVSKWPPGTPLNATTLKAAEKGVSQAILQLCLGAVTHANATRTDPFGFGARYIDTRDQQQELLPGEHWTYPRLQTSVSVTVELFNTGVTQ